MYMLHFANLKSDMHGAIRDLARFPEIPINEETWDDILLHCSFDYMKANATKSVPLGGAFWDGGAETFIHRGVNGRWRDVLSNDEVAAYEERSREELGGECALWLATNNKNWSD